MIVKNAAKTLRGCLASVAGVVSQMVVADTGSDDGTPDLARASGAEVFHFPWQDDFSQARNAAIQAVATDWVLVMDDDEELAPEGRNKIASLLTRAAIGGYTVTQRNHIPVSFGSGGHAAAVKPGGLGAPPRNAARGYADFASCRLFRRHPAIRYAGRVHEQIEPQIRGLDLKIAPADVVIHHFGHLCSPAKLHSKNEFYRKLGRLKVQDSPNDPQAWIELGLQEYEQFKNYTAGIACFQEALALDPTYSTVPYLSLANLYVEIRAEGLALDLLSQVPIKGRAAGVKEDICGDAFHNLGLLKKARVAYLRAQRILPEDERIASKLGLTEVRLGLRETGIARLTRSLKRNPALFETHDRLIKAYIVANMLPQAAEAAERLATELPNAATILRAASIRAHMKQSQAAADFVMRGLEQFPHDAKLLQARAQS